MNNMHYDSTRARGSSLWPASDKEVFDSEAPANNTLSIKTKIHEIEEEEPST